MRYINKSNNGKHFHWHLLHVIVPSTTFHEWSHLIIIRTLWCSSYYHLHRWENWGAQGKTMPKITQLNQDLNPKTVRNSAMTTEILLVQQILNDHHCIVLRMGGEKVWWQTRRTWSLPAQTHMNSKQIIPRIMNQVSAKLQLGRRSGWQERISRKGNSMYKYLEVRTYSREQGKRAWKNKTNMAGVQIAREITGEPEKNTSLDNRGPGLYDKDSDCVQ